MIRCFSNNIFFPYPPLWAAKDYFFPRIPNYWKGVSQCSVPSGAAAWEWTHESEKIYGSLRR